MLKILDRILLAKMLLGNDFEVVLILKHKIMVLEVVTDMLKIKGSLNGFTAK